MEMFGACDWSGSCIWLCALEQHVFGWNHADAAGIIAAIFVAYLFFQ